MKKEFLRAYASTVTANGMFNSISSIPLHDSFKSYDAINSIYSYEDMNNIEARENKKQIEKYSNLIRISAFMGQKLTENLAIAFEDLKSHLAHMTEVFNKDELEALIELMTVIKENKDY